MIIIIVICSTIDFAAFKPEELASIPVFRVNRVASGIAFHSPPVQHLCAHGCDVKTQHCENFFINFQQLSTSTNEHVIKTFA